MIRRDLLKAAAAAAVTSPFVISEARAETMTWRMPNVYPRGPGFAELHLEFAEMVKRMTGGRLSIEVVYDGEGIGATEVLGAVKSGLAEMGAPYMALHAGEIPAGLLEVGLPGAPTAHDELLALFYDAGFADVLREAYAAQNLHWLGEIFYPGTYLLTKNQVASLADLNGLKIRAPGAYGTFLRGFGVSPVTIAFGEIYTSLSTGVIDGVGGSPLIDMRDGKFFEVAKNLFPLQITGTQASPIVVNLDKWKALPDDLKACLEAAMAWTTSRNAIKAVAWQKKAVDQMKGAGLAISTAPAADEQKKWKDAGLALWNEYESKDEYSKKLIGILRKFVS